jgi:23S rRNA (uracil1939-C5)-methyltransferase
VAASVDTLPEVTLHGVAHGGEAVGRIGEKVAFVAYALPGERVALEVTEARPRYVRGRVAELLEGAPTRATPPCPIFGLCGGCHWQHATYPAQLDFKTEVLRDLLARLGRFPDPPVVPAVPSPEPWHYRNAVQMIPSRVRGASAAEPRRLCFQRAHSHDPVPVEHCYISDPLINRLVEGAPWDAFALGTWQRLSGVELRVVPGAAAQVTLVGGRRPAGEETARFLRGARAAVPELKGLLFASRRGETPRLLWGTPSLVYSLAGEALEAPSGVFVQVNLGAAALLVERALEWLAPSPEDAVLDVYAGVGTFSLPLARRTAAVIAIESDPRAAAALSENAARAGETNVKVQQGVAEVTLPRLEGRVDLALVDPPRRGCAPEVLDALVRLAPRRLVYVSCDPSTLARDLRRLVDAGYHLARTGVVDLFPQTYHVESCSLLERPA